MLFFDKDMANKAENWLLSGLYQIVQLDFWETFSYFKFDFNCIVKLRKNPASQLSIYQQSTAIKCGSTEWSEVF